MRQQPGYFYTVYDATTKRYTIYAVGPKEGERISRYYADKGALERHTDRLRARGWRWAAEMWGLA